MARKYPVLTALWVTPQERALIDAAAELQGAASLHQFLRGIVLPAVAQRVASSAHAMAGEQR